MLATTKTLLREIKENPNKRSVAQVCYVCGLDNAKKCVSNLPIVSPEYFFSLVLRINWGPYIY